MKGEGGEMNKDSRAFELDFEEWASSGQLEMYQKKNFRRNQDPSSNVNFI